MAKRTSQCSVTASSARAHVPCAGSINRRVSSHLPACQQKGPHSRATALAEERPVGWEGVHFGTLLCAHGGPSRHGHVRAVRVAPEPWRHPAPARGSAQPGRRGLPCPHTWAVQGKAALHEAAGGTLEDTGGWLVPWEGETRWSQGDGRCVKAQGMAGWRDGHSPQGGMQAGAGGEEAASDWGPLGIPIAVMSCQASALVQSRWGPWSFLQDGAAQGGGPWGAEVQGGGLCGSPLSRDARGSPEWES